MLKHEQRKNILKTAAVTAIGLTAALSCIAAQAGDYAFSSYGRGVFTKNTSDKLRIVSVGGAVSTPSETPVNGENPAGLVFNNGPKVTASIETHPKKIYGLLGNSYGFFTGNHLVGGKIGARTYSNSSDSSGAISYFDFGLATYSEYMNIAFGLDGYYRFRKQGTIPIAQEEKSWATNLGMIINPMGVFRLGLTGYGIGQGIEAVGAGVSGDVNQYSTMGVDVSTAGNGGALTVKPSIAIIASPFMITYGYGVRFGDENASAGIPKGNTLGLGFQLSQSLRIQGSYNQHSLYYLSAAISF